MLATSTRTRRFASWSRLVDDAVRALAKAAGVAVDWIDAADQPQRVSIGSLRRILDGLGYPNGSKSDIAESRRRLRDLANGARAFFTATVGEPITAGTMRLPAIHEPGYHRLNESAARSRLRWRRRAASRPRTWPLPRASSVLQSSSIRCGASAMTALAIPGR